MKLKRIKKKLIATTKETQEFDAHEVWAVTWKSRYGQFSSDVEKECEFFTNEEEAIEFNERLEDAFKLIRHSSGIKVEIEARHNK